MKLIKNAFVYRIDLPSHDLIAKHLAELPHREILPTEACGAGFVPVHDTDIIAQFDGGFAFSVRYDEKILPSGVINAEAKRRIADIELHSGAKISKLERQAVKEQVAVDLLRVSHVRSQTVTSFYHPSSRLLIVPVSSTRMAGVITGLLVRAVGAAKTEMINVSDVKGGLTTRLAGFLAQTGDDPFGEFDLEPEVWLKGEAGKVSYQIDSISTGDRGLVEALNSGMRVEAVRLAYAGVSFKLTSDFTFKGIRFDDPAEPQDHDNALEYWEHEAAVQVLGFTQTVEALCELFGYQELAGDSEVAA
jgi:recombination associated protein RdgC